MSHHLTFPVRLRKASVGSRLHMVEGALHTAGWLLAQGRHVEAIALLRAARAALGVVAAQISRDRVLRCLDGPDVSKRVELMALFGHMARARASRAHRRDTGSDARRPRGN